jgi:hypothetical protein
MSGTSPADTEDIDDISLTETATPSSAEDTGAEHDDLLDAVADSIDTEFEADADLDVEKELADIKAQKEDDPDPQETVMDPKTETDPTEAETTDDQDITDEPDEAELAGYKPKTRKRIEKLLGERNELRHERAEYAPFIEAMTNHDINREDITLLLGAGAALRKGDFEAFLAGVMPYVETAQSMVGQRLSPDLEDQVNQGYVSSDAARELAQRRAHEQYTQGEQERTRKRDDQQAVDRHAMEVTTGISDWEKSIALRDPDYSQKADAVRRYAQALIQEHGAPRSAAQAVEYAEHAYKEVSELTKSVAPQRQPTRRTPSSDHSSNAHGAQTEPGSLMEAAMQGLAASGS